MRECGPYCETDIARADIRIEVFACLAVKYPGEIGRGEIDGGRHQHHGNSGHQASEDDSGRLQNPTHPAPD